MGGLWQLQRFTCAERSEPLTVGGSPSTMLVTLCVPRLSCLIMTLVTRVMASRMFFRSSISAPRGETEAQEIGTQPQDRLL
jgi:hypothetical protein